MFSSAPETSAPIESVILPDKVILFSSARAAETSVTRATIPSAMDRIRQDLLLSNALQLM